MGEYWCTHIVSNCLRGSQQVNLVLTLWSCLNRQAFLQQTARCGVRCPACYNQRISNDFGLILLATWKHGEAEDIPSNCSSFQALATFT